MSGLYHAGTRGSFPAPYCLPLGQVSCAPEAGHSNGHGAVSDAVSLSWCLFTALRFTLPLQYALHVYNEVMNMGQKYGIRNAGYYALRSLRIEKFFAFWGQDLDAFTTPMECGREFQVKLEKVQWETEIYSCTRVCHCTRGGWESNTELKKTPSNGVDI